MNVSLRSDGSRSAARCILVRCTAPLVFLLPFSSGIASPGDLDAGFGDGGVVLTDVDGGSFDRGLAVVIQADGRIVVAGGSAAGSADRIALVRYDGNGDLDSGNFGTQGISVIPSASPSDFAHANSLLLQDDGRLVAGGFNFAAAGPAEPEFALIRLTDDGSVDAEFTPAAGHFTAQHWDVPAALALQADGRIVQVGSALQGMGLDYALARYLPNGGLDEDFADGGRRLASFSSLDNAYAVAVQEDGGIVIAGSSALGASGMSIMSLARFGADGDLDGDFGTSGHVVAAISPLTSEARALAIQPDGGILVAGWAAFPAASGTETRFALARFTGSGEPDASFGTGGVVTTAVPQQPYAIISALVLQPDGGIVVAGEVASSDTGDDRHLAVARYDANGTLDQDFGDGGIVIVDVDGISDAGAHAVALQEDGGIVVAGSAFNAASGSNDVIVLRLEGAEPADSDGDGVPDHLDNCVLAANPDQRDTDGDGYGNRCDGDFNNDGIVNFIDLAFFRANFGTTNPHADLDGNGNVNFIDLAIFQTLFGQPPGPSGLVP